MSPDPVRMSQLGPGSAAVLRIVSYFDTLAESTANADTIVRSAALAAECPVGAHWVSGTVIRYDAAGRLDVKADAPDAPQPREEPAVWLERTGSDHALDPVLLDRVRHLLRMTTTRVGVPVQVGDPALLELVLSDRASREEQARSVRLLGLDDTRQVRVLAVSASVPSEALKVIRRELPDHPAPAGTTGTVTALLCYGGQDVRALSDRLNVAITKAFPRLHPLMPIVDRGSASARQPPCSPLRPRGSRRGRRCGSRHRPATDVVQSPTNVSVPWNYWPICRSNCSMPTRMWHGSTRSLCSRPALSRSTLPRRSVCSVRCAAPQPNCTCTTARWQRVWPI